MSRKYVVIDTTGTALYGHSTRSIVVLNVHPDNF